MLVHLFDYLGINDLFRLKLVLTHIVMFCCKYISLTNCKSQVPFKAQLGNTHYRDTVDFGITLKKYFSVTDTGFVYMFSEVCFIHGFYS